jgi:hypothetical protein
MSRQSFIVSVTGESERIVLSLGLRCVADWRESSAMSFRIAVSESPTSPRAGSRGAFIGWRTVDALRQRRTPNHALQRTRPSRYCCNRRVPWAGSLSLGR